MFLVNVFLPKLLDVQMQKLQQTFQLLRSHDVEGTGQYFLKGKKVGICDDVSSTAV